MSDNTTDIGPPIGPSSDLLINLLLTEKTVWLKSSSVSLTKGNPNF